MTFRSRSLCCYQEGERWRERGPLSEVCACVSITVCVTVCVTVCLCHTEAKLISHF